MFKKIKMVKHKCLCCGETASLELDDGRWICEECAQIQGELAEMED